MKNEKIVCTLYFKNLKTQETISKFSTLNPYTGMIDMKFVSLKPEMLEFNYNNSTYKFDLYTVGGKYFIKEYEASPFNMLFRLDVNLVEKKKKQPLKIKI